MVDYVVFVQVYHELVLYVLYHISHIVAFEVYFRLLLELEAAFIVSVQFDEHKSFQCG